MMFKIFNKETPTKEDSNKTVSDDETSWFSNFTERFKKDRRESEKVEEDDSSSDAEDADPVKDNKITWFTNLKEKITNDKKQESDGDPHQDLYDIDKAPDSPSWFSTFTERFQKDEPPLTDPSPSDNIAPEKNVSLFTSFTERFQKDEPPLTDPSPSDNIAPEKSVSLFSSFTERFQKNETPSADPTVSDPNKNVSLLDRLKNRFDKNSDVALNNENEADLSDPESKENGAMNWLTSIKGKFRKDSESQQTVVTCAVPQNTSVLLNGMMIDKRPDERTKTAVIASANVYQSSENAHQQVHDMNKCTTDSSSGYYGDEPDVLTDNENTAVRSRMLHDTHTSSNSLSDKAQQYNKETNNTHQSICENVTTDTLTHDQNLCNSNSDGAVSADTTLSQGREDEDDRNWINRLKQQFIVPIGRDKRENRADHVSAEQHATDADKGSDIPWFTNIKQQLRPGNNNDKKQVKENNKDTTFLSGFRKIFNKKEDHSDDNDGKQKNCDVTDNEHFHTNTDVQTSSDDDSEPEENDRLISDRHKINSQKPEKRATRSGTSYSILNKNNSDFKMQESSLLANQSSPFSTIDKNTAGETGYNNPFYSGSDSEHDGSISQTESDRPLTLLEITQGKRVSNLHEKREHPKISTQASVDSSCTAKSSCTANTVTDSDDNQDMQELFKRVSQKKQKPKTPQRPVLSDDDDDIDDMEIFNDVSIRQIRESLNSVDSSKTVSQKSCADTESDISKSAHEEKSITKSIKKRWKKIVKKQKSITKKQKNKRLSRDASLGTTSNASDSENMTGTSIDLDSGMDGNGWASEYKHNTDSKYDQNDVNERNNQSDSNKKTEPPPQLKLKDLIPAKSVDNLSNSIISNVDSGDDVAIIKSEKHDKISKTKKMANNNELYSNPSFSDDENMKTNSKIYDHSTPHRKGSSFESISLNIDNRDLDVAHDSSESMEKQDSVEKGDSDKILTSPSTDFEKRSEMRSDVTSDRSEIHNSDSVTTESVKAEVGWFKNLKQKLNIGDESEQKASESTNSVNEQKRENTAKETGFFDSLKERFTPETKQATQNEGAHARRDSGNAESQEPERSESPSWLDNLKQKMNIGNDNKESDKSNTANDRKDASGDSNWFENFKQRMFNDDDGKDNQHGDKMAESDQETHVIKISRHKYSDSESDHDTDDSVFIHSASENKPVKSVKNGQKTTKVATNVKEEKLNSVRTHRDVKEVTENDRGNVNKGTTLSEEKPDSQMKDSPSKNETLNAVIDQNESDSEIASSLTNSSKENKSVAKLNVNGLKKSKTKRRSSSRNDLYNSQNEELSDTGSSEAEDMRSRSNGSSERRKRLTHNHSHSRNKQMTNKRVGPLGQPEKVAPYSTPKKDPSNRPKTGAPPPVVISVKDRNRPTNFDPLSYKGGTGRKLPQIPKKPSNLAYSPPDPEPDESKNNSNSRNQPQKRDYRKMQSNNNRLSVEDAERMGHARNFASSKHRWDEIDYDTKRFELPEQQSSESEWTAMGHDRPSVSGSSTAWMEHNVNVNSAGGDVANASSRSNRGSESHDTKYKDKKLTSPESAYVSRGNPPGASSDPYSRRHAQPRRGPSRDEWEDYRRSRPINIPFHWNCCAACQSD